MTCCVFLPGLLYALAVTSSQNSVFNVVVFYIPIPIFQRILEMFDTAVEQGCRLEGQRR